MNNKISVREFINNPELFEQNYTPYLQKVDIAKAILVATAQEEISINSALYERIRTQVLIESITNLDLSVVDEETNLDGFDLLNYMNLMDIVLDYIFLEYTRFCEIIDMELIGGIQEHGEI